VRSTLARGRIARTLFCMREARMVLLHAFIKKTRKTPAAELASATKRMRELA